MVLNITDFKMLMLTWTLWGSDGSNYILKLYFFIIKIKNFKNKIKTELDWLPPPLSNLSDKGGDSHGCPLYSSVLNEGEDIRPVWTKMEVGLPPSFSNIDENGGNLGCLIFRRWPMNLDEGSLSTTKARHVAFFFFLNF